MMKDQTNSRRLSTIPYLYDQQTRYFMRSLESISDSDSHSRLGTNANHIAWLAGSLVQQRHELAGMLNPGTEYKQRADELFRNNQGIKREQVYPPLEEFVADWQRISPVARDLLLMASDDFLDRELPMDGYSFPVFDMIIFMVYREASMIGQIALWRRLLDYTPMNYM